MWLIDRDELKTAICIACSNGVIQIAGCEFDGCAIQRLIDEQPEVEAEPVRHGRWKPIGARLCGGNTDSFQCSECEFLARALKAGKECGYDFCPNCGARMDGVING